MRKLRDGEVGGERGLYVAGSLVRFAGFGFRSDFGKFSHTITMVDPANETYSHG